MSSLAPTRLNIFGLGGDHFLYWKYKGAAENAWTDYHRNEGGRWALHGPVTLSRVLNEISIFMVGEDGSLKHSNFDLVNMGDFGPWTTLGGKLSAPPAVAKRKGGILHIFYIGSDHALYHKAWDGVVYTPAEGFDRLEGEFSRTPTAVSTGPDDVSVFAIGLDNRLHHYQWNPVTGWGGREKLPGHWADCPKAASDQVGSLDVFGIDAGGDITHISCRNGKDWKHEVLRGTFRSLDAISLETGCVDILALAETKTIFHKTLRNGTWEAWENLKGTMEQPPKAVSHSPGLLGVISVGPGGVVYYKIRDVKTGSWTEWFDLKGVIISPVG